MEYGTFTLHQMIPYNSSCFIKKTARGFYAPSNKKCMFGLIQTNENLSFQNTR